MSSYHEKPLVCGFLTWKAGGASFERERSMKPSDTEQVLKSLAAVCKTLYEVERVVVRVIDVLKEPEEQQPVDLSLDDAKRVYLDAGGDVDHTAEEWEIIRRQMTYIVNAPTYSETVRERMFCPSWYNSLSNLEFTKRVRRAWKRLVADRVETCNRCCEKKE